MQRILVHVALCLVGAVPLFAQATSEWNTSHGLPVAVVEVAGGDDEVIAAALPVGASPPDAVASFPTTVTPQRGVLLWAVRVPALLAQEALAEFVRTLATTGAAAVVLLGPTPARELQEALGALEAVPVRPLPRNPCVLPDGGIEVRRGGPEKVVLALAMPGPGDPRYDLLPALAALVRIRLLATFPHIRVESELEGGCTRLRVEEPVGPTESPRLVLRRVRQRLAEVAATVPTADEAARAAAASGEGAARAAVSGRAVAEELAQRLALGGTTAGALASPALDPASLGELARDLLAGHAGFATVVEQERRPQDEAPETLADGAVLSVRWLPSETGVVAIALGGVNPRTGHALLAAAADSVARAGWAATVGEVLGVPTLAVAARGEAIVSVMERVSDVVAAQPSASAQSSAPDDLEHEVARAEGLAEQVSAESISVALALPPDVDEGPEAGRKFFGGLESAGVRSGAGLPGPGLTWAVRDGEPGVVGLVDLPATTAGLVAGQIVRDRVAGEPGVRTLLLAPPGRVVLAVVGEGGAHVPAVDERLASLWRGACRACSPAELATAAHRLLARLYGDPAQATSRAAAAVFLPQLPTVTALLSTEVAEARAALGAFPRWEQLPRIARGRAPQVVIPQRGVRKSPPGR